MGEEQRTLTDGDASIGRQIRETREAAGLSQLELAERAGLTQGNLSWIETGRRGVGVEVLNRLADALGATWGYDGGRMIFRRR